MSQSKSRWGLASLAVFALTACSGGSSAAPPGFDSTGHWLTWLEDPTTMEEMGPFGSYLVQTGPSVDGVGVTGTVSGNNLTATVDLGLFALLEFAGTMSGGEISGTYEMTGFPVVGDFRMQPFSPTGTVTAVGQVGGLAIGIDTSTAFGERKYDDVALTSLIAVNVVVDDGALRFEIDFRQPGSLGVGTLDASAVPVDVYAGDDITSATLTATSGTVTITQYDAGGFAASFNLALPGAESVTGSFDVAFDIDAYEPP